MIQKHKFSKEQILAKLQRYCAYQDRCHQEVRQKLLDMHVYGEMLEQIMSDLIQDNFLNEERFAKSFARGKFNLKGWGRVKIEVELKARNISSYCIKKAMLEIEEEEYSKKLQGWIDSKMDQFQSLPFYERKHKTYEFCVKKGFEVDNVLKQLPKGSKHENHH